MPSNGVTIKAPVKGVDKQAAWGERDADYAIDAMNVLPYDLDGRKRIVQRPGTSLLFGTPLADTVKLLAQTTVPVDPTSKVPDITTLLDPFTDPDGTGLMLSTTYGQYWSTHRNVVYPGLDQGQDQTTFWRIVDNRAHPLDPANYIHTAVLHTGTTNVFNSTGLNLSPVLLDGYLGDTYTLKAKVKFSSTNSSLQAGLGFVTRVNHNSFSSLSQIADDTVYVMVNTHHVAIYRGNNSNLGSYLFSPSLNASVEHDLELRVVAGVYNVYVDGVLRLTVTPPTKTSIYNDNVGLYANGGNSNDYIDNFQLLTIKQRTAYRQTNLIAVGGTSVYVGTKESLPLATGGSGVVTGKATPQFAYSAGKGYMVDGTNTLQVDIAAASVSTLTATAGSIPTGCTLAALYRDRLVLAAPYANPHLFYASRAGTASDFDYSQTDPAAAFAGNASTAGHIGDPLTALMPAGDDMLYLGGDHTLHVIRGDPADGGSIDLVSDAIGVLGPNAWCKAPDGTIYFLGPGGIYKLAGNTPPELVTGGNWNEYFRQLDRGGAYFSMVWDRDKHGLYLFVTPLSGQGTHLWYDARNGGLWPIQYPGLWGPYSALVYDGDAPGDRVTLLGGQAGYLFRMYDTDGGDNGNAINSYVYIGPFTDNDLSEQTAEWFDVILGEPASFHTTGDWQVNVTVQSGQTPQEAYAAPKLSMTRNYLNKAGRQTRWRQRIRGNSFVVKLWNDQANQTWAFERIVGMFLPSGTVRRT
jgi:hypothetical protein